MGFPILYHILNKLEGVYAERVFAPWPDMESKMRENDIPLFSLETFTPLRQFDLVGFTLQYELHYTTILNLLSLARIPFKACERDGLPLVVGGGPCAFNPEPMADFFDAFVIGDGEEAVVTIAEAIREGKKKKQSRMKLLNTLAQIDGFYVPEFYRPQYDKNGRFKKRFPTHECARPRIKACVVEELPAENYPTKPLVPIIETTHDRVAIEIARGCSRGCRFCNAGMIYRPVRQRSVKDLVKQAEDSIRSTGYDEVSLVSLSTSDYEPLNVLMAAMHERLGKEMVNISFPSLRPEKFTPDVAVFAKGVRKSGLTLAPEAGSHILRSRINKTTTAEDLLRAVDLAYREGWRQVKLYFMIGLPGESYQDLEAMIHLINQVSEVARLHRGRQVSVSISPFVPKPITPFQWVRQDSAREIKAKIDFLCSKLRTKNIKMSWRQGEVAAVEGVLARGDRRMAQVIRTAWENGARFDGWGEFFDFDTWQLAMQKNGLSFELFNDGYDPDAPLPWDFVDKGVTKKFLKDELERAHGEKITPDCRDGECNRCGLMGKMVCKEIIRTHKKSNGKTTRTTTSDTAMFSPPKKVEINPVANPRLLRVKYRRDEHVQFLSHLDMLRLFERALRRARIPLAYTEGFNPRPKISYGPPLATGYTSDGEYFDVHYSPEKSLDFIKQLNPELPKGIKILETKQYYGKTRSLTALINRAEYEIEANGLLKKEELNDRIEHLKLMQSIFVKRTKEGEKDKEIDVRPFVDDIRADENVLYLKLIMENGRSARVHEILQFLMPDGIDSLRLARVKRIGLWVQYGNLLVSPMDV